MTLPSDFDNVSMLLSRDFINLTRSYFFEHYCVKSGLICDIGNQGKNIPGSEKFNIVTLDITSNTSPDIVADISIYNEHIPEGSYDSVMCTEVLEHVVDPFAAVRELHRIVKKNGYILFTTPLNARIHGPIPDCWRFTEFGLKVLFRDFETVYFKKLETKGRNLFPLHYGVIVKKINDHYIDSDPRNIKFSPVD